MPGLGRKAIGLLAAAFLVSVVAGCRSTSQHPEFAAYDPLYGSNAAFYVRPDAFPQDHWAYHQVQAVEANRVMVVLNETSKPETVNEAICYESRIIIASQDVDAHMRTRVRYWSAVTTE